MGRTQGDRKESSPPPKAAISDIFSVTIYIVYFHRTNVTLDSLNEIVKGKPHLERLMKKKKH